MHYKTVSRGLIALLLVVFVSSFSYELPSKAYSPAGTWEYSVPDVPDGYQKGTMTIIEKENGYGVTMALNEYSKAEGEKVKYEKLVINFSVWVEGEEVIISGTFDKDNFSGTVNYSGGEAKFTATRKKE
jgi:hypothetical protein